MSGGEVNKVTFTQVAEPSIKAVRLDVPPFPQKECCFKLPVLAELVSKTDEFKNDQHSVLGKYDSTLFSIVLLILQKYENGDWVDKVQFNDDTYGTQFGWGFETNSEGTQKFVGYRVDWFSVLNDGALGEGTYRFRFREFDFAAAETESFYPFEFCLKEYKPFRADKTVRFEWYTKGYRGDFEDDLDIWDYTRIAKAVNVDTDGWFNQMRLPDAFFGDNTSNYEREYIRYSNGQQVWIQDEQVEAYNFHSGLYPAQLHNWIKTNIIQADRILVTDYNKTNPNLFNNKAVKPNGNYEPSWNYNNLKAFVSVPFIQEFQNRRKLRC